MIRQVFVKEEVPNSSGITRSLLQLAFGTHPDVDEEDDDREVVAATAAAGQEIRIVFDELVKGNAIEEVACADGSFSRIPDGTTPDDIAKCSGPVESLTDCKGKHAVCVGDSGPVGVLDEVGFSPEPDGAADDFRMIEYEPEQLVAAVTCEGVNIPLDRELSFWDPSGNQLIPGNATLGVRGLGPVLVLVPRDGMRTSSTCTISFRPELTDKDGHPPCTPPGGDVEQDCAGVGDVSLISFGSEPLILEFSDPAHEQEGVPTSQESVLLQFNAPVSMESLSNLTLVEMGGGDVAITPMAQAEDPTLVLVNINDALAPNTTYTLTVPTAVTDLFGGALPQEEVITFTTADATPTPDAGPMTDAMADAS